MKLSLSEGRINQKQQTRSILIEAADRLIKDGRDFSLDDVANESGVSRATVYRYFSNTETLKLECTIDMKAINPKELMVGMEGATLQNRIMKVTHHIFSIVEENEIAFRTYVSSVLRDSAINANSGKSWRAGRRRAMLIEAFRPYRKNYSSEDYDCLLDSLSVLTGIESYFSFKDICKLNYEQSIHRVEWALNQFLSAPSKKNA